MTLEEQKKELLRLIANSLTVPSDEMEGTQKIDIETVHGCNTDYISYTESAMTLEEIAEKYHLPIDTRLPDDRSIWPSADGSGDGGNDDDGYPGDNDGRSHTVPAGLDDDLTGDGDSDGRQFPADDGRTLDDIVNDIISDPSIGPNRALVEFAQPCIRDKAGVDFSLNIRPGQQLNEETVIGRATIDGREQYVKSIFSGGTVMGTPDGCDFYRLYEGTGANRHFIVDNYVLGGQATELNTEALEDL